MKYSLRRIMLILCCLTVMLGLIACSKKDNDNPTKIDPAQVSEDNKEEATTTPDVEVEEAGKDSNAEMSETVYPFTITDSDGVEVIIDSEPMRVVSMAPNITETIYQLGLEDKLIGRTEYCDYPVEALNIESVGDMITPDIEKIISLNPDVVIVSTHIAVEHYARLKEMGVKVVHLYEGYEIEGVYTVLESLGKLLNANNEATIAINEMKTTIEETRSVIDGQKKPSVYYVVGYGEYGDYTSGGNTFVGQVLTMAGGANIAQDIEGWSYSLESLVEADPDIIILPTDMKADFEASENYKDLTAVKNGKVYGIDKNLIERQGYRNAEGIKTLAEMLYPEVFN